MGDRDALRATVGKWYRGEAHLAFTLLASSGMTLALASRVRDLRAAQLWTVPLFFLFCCLAEYLEHRYLLHRNSRLGAVAFRIHTLEHHRFFTEADFAPEGRRDFAYILFPPRLVLGYLLGLVGLFTAASYFAVSPNVGWLVGATASLFFFLYEVIHFASHLETRVPLLRQLGEHHRRHHRVELMTEYNFNVVCPIFDWLFGTLTRGA